MKSINKDYKGWLIVNVTDVNYPVVQTDNDSYYLHHSFYNEKSIEGNPFIYDKTNIDSCLNLYYSNTNKLIMFGHNMRNRIMFKSISNFKDTNFFNNHKYIEFIRNGKVYVY